jgi:hypothetical protein
MALLPLPLGKFLFSGACPIALPLPCHIYIVLPGAIQNHELLLLE